MTTRVRISHSTLTRHQILVTSLISFAAAAVFTVINTPFSAGFPAIAFASGVFHLSLFTFFPRIFPTRPAAFVLFSVANLLLLGLSIHFTGGILSPFVFFFILIAVSDAANGIDYALATYVGAFIYLATIAAEWSGLLPPTELSPSAVYASGATTILIVGVTLFFMIAVAGSYKNVMRSLRDDLEREQAARERVRAKLAELEAPSQVGLLVNKIMHDVRGPLGAASGFMSCLSDDETLAADIRDDCGLMRDELQRIDNLTERVLSYTRPSEGAAVLSPDEAVHNVVSVLSFHPAAKGVTIDVRGQNETRGRILFRKEELQQVLFNVIKNAVEAVGDRERKNVTIALSIKEPWQEIAIEDSGAGFEQAVMKKVSQERATTKAGGQGLGLIIVREILSGYGGTLHIGSGPLGGARVLLRIPLHRTAETKRSTT